eukprot:UN27852
MFVFEVVSSWRSCAQGTLTGNLHSEHVCFEYSFELLLSFVRIRLYVF